MELLRTVARKIRGATLLETPPRQELRPGSLVRVRVTRKIDAGSVLVEIRGRIHPAQVKGPVPGRLFMARVLAISPRIVLKYVKDLTGATDTAADRLFRLLNSKDSLVHRMFNSERFFQHPVVVLPGSKHSVKEALRRDASQRQGSSLRRMTQRKSAARNSAGSASSASVIPGGKDGEIARYLGLQQLYNFLDSRSILLLFPLLLGNHKSVARLRMLDGESGQGGGFVLNVVLEDETKINFVVFINYERVSCSVSTNRDCTERWIRGNRELLVNAIRSSCYGRNVDVQVLPYSEQDEKILHVRRIDLRM